MDLIWKILNPANLLPYKSLGGGDKLKSSIFGGGFDKESSFNPMNALADPRKHLKSGGFAGDLVKMLSQKTELPAEKQRAPTEQRGVGLLKGKYESFYKPRK